MAAREASRRALPQLQTCNGTRAVRRNRGERSHMRKLTRLKFGSASLAVSAALLSTPSHAQTTDGQVDLQTSAQADTVEDEAIVVVGSRIQRVDTEAPLPVQVFDEELIDATGSATLEDFLFNSNLAGPGIFNENATLSQLGGTSLFETRGFGTEYTVILLNGRRLPGTPTTGEAGTDLNQIPLAAVEQVQFLSSGASAIYGADAIAGVLNIVTRRDFEGVSARARVGISDRGDGLQRRASVVAGAAGDRGSAILTAEVFHQDEIWSKDRPLSRSSLHPEYGDGRSPSGFPGTWIRGDFSEAVAFDDCPAESISADVFTGGNGTNCFFDTAPLYQNVPDTLRTSASAFVEYDLFDDLNVWTDLRYARVFSKVRNGAAPATFGPLPADTAGNPWPGEEVWAVRRLVDAGPRSTDVTNQTFSVAGGFDWDFADDHALSGYYQHSWVDNNQIGVSGMVSLSALTEQVEAGNFNFTGYNTPEVIDAITVSTFRVAQLSEDVVNLSLTGTFEPGGLEVGYAVGAELRDEYYTDRVDASTEARDIAGGAGSSGGGGRDSKAAYAELRVSPFDMLELQAAGRYDEIGSDAGVLGDKFTYSLAGTFQPIDEVTLRANYGTGFRAPSLGELYLAESFGVTTAIDTPRCDEAKAGGDPDDIEQACNPIEIRSVGGGNALLEPEDATYWGAGIVLQPTDNIRLAADYWNIEINNKIGQISVQTILNDTARYGDRINRVGGSLTHPDASVETSLTNMTTTKGDGIDFTLNATQPVGPDVTLLFDVRASYLMSRLTQTNRDDPLCENAGTTSEPEWRGNARLGVQANGFVSNVTARYTGRTEDYLAGFNAGTCDVSGGSENIHQTDDYVQFDWNISYEVNENFSATFGVRNVFDKTPPGSPIFGWPFYDTALYDNMGRFFYVEAGIDF